MTDGKKKKKDGADELKSNSWMVTFSDLSTLLLTFFVLLLSMASMDDLSMKSLFHSFTASCGILNFKEYGEIAQPKEALISGLHDLMKDTLVVKTHESEKDETDQTESYDTDLKLLEGVGGSLVIEELDDGFKIVFGEGLLFPSGSAEIKADMMPVLEKITKFMRSSYNQIYIDGHTDSVPIRSGVHSSNEALSLERAYRVLKYFVQDKKMTSRTVAMAGYGELQPIASNDTAEGRSKNRRVEIIFKNKKYF